MRSTLMLRTRQTSILLGLLGLSAHSMAGEFTYSGFATVAVGKVMGGSNNAPLNTHFDCPCYIADYGQGAVYEREWSLGQESKVGVQGTYKFTPSLSATGQVVARGVDGGTADVEWAFLSYEASPNWTLQAGRKRLPMYFFSDFQDVGYAYNWVRQEKPLQQDLRRQRPRRNLERHHGRRPGVDAQLADTALQLHHIQGPTMGSHRWLSRDA